jgi:hypothetical protein
MKQKDIALILVVIFFSAIFSLVISQMLFKPPKQNMTIEKVETISSEFKAPDKSVFNERAINPTQLIQTGGSTGNNPF